APRMPGQRCQWRQPASRMTTARRTTTIAATAKSPTPATAAVRLIVVSSIGSPTDIGGPSTRGLPAPGWRSSAGGWPGAGVCGAPAGVPTSGEGAGAGAGGWARGGSSFRSSSSCVLIFLFDPRKHPVEAAAGHGRVAVLAFSDLVDLQRSPTVGADLVEDAPACGVRAHRALKCPVLDEL